MLFMRQRHFQPTERVMLLPEALDLGLFAAVGVDFSMAIGMPPVIGVMMGVITGVFGGVLRDVLCNEVPQAFTDHRPYAGGEGMKNGAKKCAGRAKTGGKRRRIAQKISSLKIPIC